MRWFPRKHRVIPEGTRVRVIQDRDFGPGPFPSEPTGRVVSPPEMVQGVKGSIPTYWIAFDEPAFDAEGDTAYARSQVAAKYLVVLG